MDNLTHSLTGLMLSQAGLNRLAPRAGLMLVLAANMPDADLVSLAMGRAAYLDIHRSYMHSWLLLPLVAAVAVLITRWSLRFGSSGGTWSWGRAWVASMVAVASHLLLDWTNNYGIRFGAPFDWSWHRLDLLFIVDPWIWLLLLFGVAAPFLSRLVSSEIGAAKTGGTGVAWFVLVCMTAYVGARYVVHERVLAVLGSRVYEGQNPRRVGAFPLFGNPLRWRAVAELDNGYWVSQVNLLEEFDPADGRVFYQSSGPLVEAARQTADFQAFLRFDAFPLWRVTDTKVELFDLRFGDPAAPGFVATMVIGGGEPELKFGTPKI